MFKVNAKLIRELIIRRGLSLREFAKQSGLNERTVGKLIHDGATASTKIIGALVRFFNVDGESLILKD